MKQVRLGFTCGILPYRDGDRTGSGHSNKIPSVHMTHMHGDQIVTMAYISGRLLLPRYGEYPRLRLVTIGK